MTDDDEDQVHPSEDEGSDADTVPGAPGNSDSALGDTDQHSTSDS